MILPRTVVVVILLLYCPAVFCSRSYSQSMFNNKLFYDSTTELHTTSCVISNPSSKEQDVTVVAYNADGAAYVGSYAANSQTAITFTLAAKTSTKVSQYSLIWGKNYDVVSNYSGVVGVPSLIEITVAQDEGHLVGNCLWYFESTGGASVTTNSILVPLNNGEPF